MRPTYDVLLAILESNPGAAYAQQVSGLTAAQAVAQLLDRMSHAADAAARDRLFSSAMACAGIYCDSVASFDRGTDDMLKHMGDRDASERHAQEISQQSRNTPHYWSPERVRKLQEVAAKASLQQRVSDRFRESDRRAQGYEKPAIPEHHRGHHDRDDAADRRAALTAAVAGSDRGRGVVRLDGDRGSLRETIADAYAVHEELAAGDDPLLNDELRGMSNAV
jgi:hypothetical protein